MENRLFRQQSMDQVNSPEQIRDYLRVTSPKLWMLIAAVLALPLVLQAGVVKGKVTCGKKPVAGVQVSDGRQIVLTDAKGRYTLKTDKADSIVFITTPSGYKAQMIDPIRPGFWQLLT